MVVLPKSHNLNVLPNNTFSILTSRCIYPYLCIDINPYNTSLNTYNTNGSVGLLLGSFVSKSISDPFGQFSIINIPTSFPPNYDIPPLFKFIRPSDLTVFNTSNSILYALNALGLFF